MFSVPRRPAPTLTVSWEVEWDLMKIRFAGETSTGKPLISLLTSFSIPQHLLQSLTGYSSELELEVKRELLDRFDGVCSGYVFECPTRHTGSCSAHMARVLP